MKNIFILLISIVALLLYFFLLSDFNGPIFFTCLMILCMASTKSEKPTKSPTVWLLWGIVVFLGFGFEAFCGWEHVANPLSASDIQNEEIRNSFNVMRKKEFISETLKSGIGILIIAFSLWKIKNPNQSIDPTR